MLCSLHLVMTLATGLLHDWRELIHPILMREQPPHATHEKASNQDR